MKTYNCILQYKVDTEQKCLYVVVQANDPYDAHATALDKVEELLGHHINRKNYNIQIVEI